MVFIVKFLSYLGFAIMLLFGLVSLTVSFKAAIIFLLGAAILHPKVREILSKALDKKVGFGIGTGIGAFSFIIGCVVFAGANEKALDASPEPKGLTEAKQTAAKAVAENKEAAKVKPTQDVAKTYQTAFNLQGQNKLAAALVEYDKVIATDRNYKDAATRAARIRSTIRKQGEAEAVYKAAFAAQGAGKKKEALDGYKKAVALVPGFKDSNTRIQALDNHFKEEERIQIAKNKKAEAAALKAAALKRQKETEKWDLAITAYRLAMTEVGFVENVEYIHNTYIGKQIHKSPEPWIQIMVSNAWHYQPRQIRKQAGENLWKVWARAALAADLVKEVDHARIKIVDLNEDEVGGSRALAGSLIWVDD